MNRQLRGNLPPNEKANGKNRFLSLLLLFMAFISVQVYAQDVKVSGTVIAEADKFPIIGANIVVKGTTIGTVTDIDGNFSLDVPQNSTIARNQDYRSKNIEHCSKRQCDRFGRRCRYRLRFATQIRLDGRYRGCWRRKTPDGYDKQFDG